MKTFSIFSIENSPLHYRLTQIAGLLWGLPLKKVYLLLSKVYFRAQTRVKRCHNYQLDFNEVHNTPSFALPTPQLKIQIPIGNASASPVLDPRGFLPSVL